MIGMPKSMMWDAEQPLGPAIKVVKVETPAPDPVKEFEKCKDKFISNLLRGDIVTIDNNDGLGARKFQVTDFGATEHRVVRREYSAPKPSEPNKNEWIEWGGGPCPLPAGTSVKLLFRDGITYIYEDAADPRLDWSHDDEDYFDGDIITYLPSIS